MFVTHFTSNKGNVKAYFKGKTCYVLFTLWILNARELRTCAEVQSSVWVFVLEHATLSELQCAFFKQREDILAGLISDFLMVPLCIYLSDLSYNLHPLHCVIDHRLVSQHTSRTAGHRWVWTILRQPTTGARGGCVHRLVYDGVPPSLPVLPQQVEVL